MKALATALFGLTFSFVSTASMAAEIMFCKSIDLNSYAPFEEGNTFEGGYGSANLTWFVKFDKPLGISQVTFEDFQIDTEIDAQMAQKIINQCDTSKPNCKPEISPWPDPAEQISVDPEWNLIGTVNYPFEIMHEGGMEPPPFVNHFLVLRDADGKCIASGSVKLVPNLDLKPTHVRSQSFGTTIKEDAASSRIKSVGNSPVKDLFDRFDK